MTDSRRHAWVRVCGASNSGKTTLIERLVPRLRTYGLRVGIVKHAHHGFEMDHEGKDSWRHAQAGANAVAIISPTRTAWLIDTTEEVTCAAAVEPLLQRVDLVLVEGFKQENASPFIRVEPGTCERLTIEEKACTVGVLVSALTADELERIVRFCLDMTQGDGS